MSPRNSVKKILSVLCGQTDVSDADNNTQVSQGSISLLFRRAILYCNRCEEVSDIS